MSKLFDQLEAQACDHSFEMLGFLERVAALANISFDPELRAIQDEARSLINAIRGEKEVPV